MLINHKGRTQSNKPTHSPIRLGKRELQTINACYFSSYLDKNVSNRTIGFEKVTFNLNKPL